MNPLYLLRQVTRLTQREFGALVGKSAGEIAAIESGRQPISEGLAVRVAAETGVSSDWLLARETEKPVSEFPQKNRPFTHRRFSLYRQSLAVARSVLMLLVLACLVLVPGCVVPRPLKPGTATMASAAAKAGSDFKASLQQPENPAQAAAQNFERTTETELPLPAGSSVHESVTEHRPSEPPLTHETTIVLSAPATQKTRTTEKAGTTVGAAQKDTAREIGAKLASMKGVMWVGVLMFLGGIATLAYPPLRLAVGSVTTSVAIIIGGLALMVLPTLIVGNELLILGMVVLAVGAWFLAHRHGSLKTLAEQGAVTNGATK